MKKDMKERSLINNVFYSIIIQLSGIIAPLILSPYISRVLNPELIGAYSFAFANSSYFTLFECLGLPLYGMIEAAKIREDKKKLSCLFFEISIIKIILTLICSMVYSAMFIFCGNTEHKTLYIVMILNLLSVGLDTTWFLSGVEDFITTAFRNVLVRIINIVMVFTFVNIEKDFIKYAIIMQGSTFFSYLIMLPTVKKYVEKISFKEMDFLKHFKPSIVYFVPGLVTTIFSSADKTILGFFANNYEVGVYEQAYKINQIFVGLISSISNALLPRAIYFSSNSVKDQSKELFENSILIAVYIAIPICFGICAIADNFVPVFFGSGYEKSSILLKILCVNMFFVALSNFYGQQALMAKGKQREYNVSILVSALANIILNVLLVHNFKSIGVSIASAASGFITFLMVSYYGKEMMNRIWIVKKSKKVVIASFIMFFIISFIYINNNLETVIVKVFFGIVLYIFLLLLLKDNKTLDIINAIRRK